MQFIHLCKTIYLRLIIPCIRINPILLRIYAFNGRTLFIKSSPYYIKKICSKFIKLRFLSAPIFPIYTFLFLFVSLLFLFLCLLFFCYCVLIIPCLLSFCYLVFLLLYLLFLCPFLLIYIFLQFFLVNSKNLLYLCSRECISNDISDDYSAAKKL